MLSLVYSSLVTAGRVRKWLTIQSLHLKWFLFFYIRSYIVLFWYIFMLKLFFIFVFVELFQQVLHMSNCRPTMRTRPRVI